MVYGLKATLFDASVLFGVGFLFVWRLILSPGLVSGIDWPYPPEPSQWAILLQTAQTTWTSLSGVFTGSQFTSIQVGDWVAVGYFFSRLGMSGPDYSKFMLLLELFTASFGCYLLLLSMKLSRFASLLGGVAYVSVPMFFDFMTQTGFAGAASVYALYPLTILFFIRGVNSSRPIYLAGFSILSAIFMLGFYPPFGAYLGFPALVLYGAYRFLKFREYKKPIACLVAVIGVGVSTQFYWLLPLFSEHAQTQFSIGLGINSFNLLSGLFFLVSYVQAYENVLLKTPILSLVCYSMLGLALMAMRTKRNVALGFVFITLIAFGASAFSTQMVESGVFFLNIFQDKTKFLIPAALAFVALFAYTADSLTRIKVPAIRILSAMMLVLLLTGYAWPYLAGGQEAQIGNISYPASYQQAADYMAANSQGYNVLWLPAGGDQILIQGQSLQSEAADYYSVLGGGGLAALADKASFAAQFAFVNEFYATNESKGDALAKEAALFNVKYVVDREDVVFSQWATSLNSPVWTRQFDNFSAVLSAGGFKEVASYPSVSIWENPFVLPRIVGASFTEVNPTLYDVTVTNSTSLSLLQTYSPYWLLNGSSPSEVFGYANGWNVTMGNYVISYSPQNAFDLGWSVSLPAFLICAVVLFWALVMGLRDSFHQRALRRNSPASPADQATPSRTEEPQR